ncbi:MAG: DUF3343 domain-containing protein [Syntrophomonadaceae bacterium]|nr:DUF3343 domain-containing protein [Syntrophomonadaceae bacterium]
MFWGKEKTKRSSGSDKSKKHKGKGLVLFDSVEEAIRAERLVAKAGYACSLVAPPPQLRKGCDVAVEIDLVEQPAIERVLEQASYVEVTPLSGSGKLLDIIQIFRYGNYTMVRAGNMKLTFEEPSGIIVNTSGGGCPDIPYLHIELMGKRLDEIPRPKDIGHTLCALMLDRAVEGARDIWMNGGEK